MKRILTVTWALALTTNSPCTALSASLPQRLAVVGETKVYSHEADYASFPGFVRGDKGFFTSDCSMSPFALWADGECGDHAYSSLLGHPLCTQQPVRYLAALGEKPWRPCGRHFQQLWTAQATLARQVGAGVGVSNGWLEYTGLTRRSGDVKPRTLADIATLFEKRT